MCSLETNVRCEKQNNTKHHHENLVPEWIPFPPQGHNLNSIAVTTKGRQTDEETVGQINTGRQGKMQHTTADSDQV